MDRSLAAREEAIRLLKFHLNRAQHRMTQHANNKCSDRQFAVGDYVYLKLQPYKQSSLKKHHLHKLLPKYFGPYEITAKVGSVAYQLGLPAEAAIHNTFHVSQLKYCPNPAAITANDIPKASLLMKGTPEEILERKMVKHGNTHATKVLVKWKNKPSDQASWEFYHQLLHQFPDFHP